MVGRTGRLSGAGPPAHTRITGRRFRRAQGHRHVSRGIGGRYGRGGGISRAATEFHLVEQIERAGRSRLSDHHPQYLAANGARLSRTRGTELAFLRRKSKRVLGISKCTGWVVVFMPRSSMTSTAAGLTAHPSAVHPFFC